jgi:pyruvate kinase
MVYEHKNDAFDFKIRTKIVATIGPAIEEEEKLKQILNYVDFIRFNFSHEPKKQIERLKFLKDVAKSIKKDIVTIADLEGPKIRTRNEEQIELKAFAKYDLGVLCIKEKAFYDVIEKNDTVLLDDGKIEVKVLNNNEFMPLNTYILSPNKTVAIKGKDFPLKGLTEKDKENIKLIKKHDFDIIAQSFIKTKDDIKDLRKLVNDKIVIAKIETVQALKNIDSIIKESDGIMVARGDLALAIDQEKVPTMQREMIKRCRDKGKPVIVATQMLDSMIKNPHPTRAEINDIYSTVLNGCDGLMLSGETAIGSFPVEAVKVIYKTILEAEKNASYEILPDYEIKDTIARQAVNIAERLNKPLIAPTVHGTTPIKISRQRPKQNIYVVTNNKRTLRYLNLFYGIRPVFFDYEPVFKKAEKIKALFKVNNAVFVFGYPPGNHNTNTIIYL